MWLLPNSFIENEDWLKCAEWLNNFDVLAEPLKTRLINNDLKLNEFAFALRDGVILCNLANALLPGSIDLTQVSKKVQTSQRLCLKNIKQFLISCKSHFNLRDDDLFQETMLYNLDIQPVLKALSILSCTQIAENYCKGFKLSDVDLSDAKNESFNDIYYNIAPVEEYNDLYTDASFILDHDEQENVYQKIIQTIPSADVMPKKQTYSKKDHVLREIFESESKFVSTLNIIINDFARPFQTYLQENDYKIVFINIEALKDLHSHLLNKLTEAVKGGQGRTSRICFVLKDFKEEMMKEYVEYFAGMQRSISKVENLLAKDKQFKQSLEEYRRNSKMKNFKLTDLIRVPYQRVLKYHLLINELNKQTDEKHNSKEDIKVTLIAMHDLAQYLNEAQRDKEIIDRIEDLRLHLSDCQMQGSTKLIDYGHIIKDDTVRIKSLDLGERIPRNRILFLFEKALFICKSKGDSYGYKETLLIHEYKIEDLSTEPQNSFQFRLCKNDGSKLFVLYFKNEAQKKEWLVRINEAIDKTQPKGFNLNNHLFVLSNFEREIVFCDICNRVLCGVFFQGYKCDRCGSIAHKDCICKFNSICVPLRNHIRVSLPRPPLRQPSISSHKSLKVQAIYQYTGRPKPPDFDCQPLKFSPGDTIQVTDDDDSEWWKGFKIGLNNIEGYFPSNYVKVIESSEGNHYVRRPTTELKLTLSERDSKDVSTRFSNMEENKQLENYSWFSAVDRSKADTILCRIQNSPSTAIFLVRPRQEGGYAISIKFNGTVEHIKIHLSKSLPTLFYLIDQRKFQTIVELINHYTQVSLEENFPQLKTPLGIPFRDLIPDPICSAIAIHDYDPGLNTTGVELELKKDEIVYVLSREKMGWWKVFNSQGLIGYSPGNYLQEIS